MGHTLANRYVYVKAKSNPGTRAGIKTLENRQDYNNGEGFVESLGFA